MRYIAESHGGGCLSDVYVNNYTKLTWQCKEGHQWEAIPRNIKRGGWCPVCCGKQTNTIEEMKELAKDHGGRCLSKEYINNSTGISWRCKEGHQWKAIPASIKRGSWCPTCAGIQKGTIEEMQDIARQRGGECVSKQYADRYSKLMWRCKDGHQWEATAEAIKRGQWCPACAGVQKGTLEEMQTIAKEREGKCLSRIYINNHSKLEWQCKKGHRWEAAPYNIKRGSWCPVCARSR